MSEALLSIIIPVYNVKDYLLHCWEGLKNQTYNNCEFLFINDCSTDGSEDILRKISLEDKRVVVLKTEMNSGVSVARNVGLDSAKGKYIGFCDADDFCLPTMYEDMIDALIKTQSDISCCAIKRVNNDNKALFNLFDTNNQFTCAPKEALGYWLDGKYIGNSVYTKVFQAELWTDIRFPIGQIFEEAYVIPQLFLKAKKIVHVGKVEYYYYCRPNSYTTKPFDEKRLVIYEREDYIHNMLIPTMPSLLSNYENFMIRNHIGAFYGAIDAKINGLISDNTYQLIRKEFLKIAFKGLKHPYVAIKNKLKIIELSLGIAKIRKSLKRRNHDKCL